MMAEKKDPLKLAKKKRSAVRKPRTVSRQKAAEKVKATPAVNSAHSGSEKSVEVKSDAAAVIDGEMVLCDSANETLLIKAKDITTKLGEKAAAGNIMSTKLHMEMTKLRNRNGRRVSKRLKELICALENDSDSKNSEENENLQTKRK